MSILVEIAARADVSVEGVVRVLTREPVNEIVKEQVLAVLDELSPAETRVVERFALAAVHDTSGSGTLGELDERDEHESLVEEGALALPSGPAVRRARPPEQTAGEDELREADMLAVRLVSLLEELVGAITDLKSASTAERLERVDDLGMLVDLITTGWQGVDRRLGQVERVVSQLEADRRPPPPAEAPTPETARDEEEPPEAEEAPAEPERRSAEPPADEERPAVRRWPAVLAVVVLGISIVIGILALLGRLPSRDSLGRLVPDRESAAPAQSTGDLPLVHRPTTKATAETTTATPRTTTTGKATPATTAAATTRATTTRAAGSTSTNPSTSTARTTTRPAAPPPAAIQPARTWAWAPVPKATYYTVEFRRGAKRIYRTVTTRPRLTLPSSVAFSPGAYRWIVRPGFGSRAAKSLGPPVVNSLFSVA